jgi:leucyl-tRNA synthetase
MAVAAEHPLALEASKHDIRVAEFLEECKKNQSAEAMMETMEKKGLPLNRYAIHPITKEKIPIWVANFVLMTYGSGAIMAVPGHDQRDWDFAWLSSVKHRFLYYMKYLGFGPTSYEPLVHRNFKYWKR